MEDEVRGDEGIYKSSGQLAARLLMSGAGLLVMLPTGADARVSPLPGPDETASTGMLGGRPA